MFATVCLEWSLSLSMLLFDIGVLILHGHLSGYLSYSPMNMKHMKYTIKSKVVGTMGNMWWFLSRKKAQNTSVFTEVFPHSACSVFNTIEYIYLSKVGVRFCSCEILTEEKTV